jgi:hypothetical protein
MRSSRATRDLPVRYTLDVLCARSLSLAGSSAVAVVVSSSWFYHNGCGRTESQSKERQGGNKWVTLQRLPALRITNWLRSG